jgi:putative membrane protein
VSDRIAAALVGIVVLALIVSGLAPFDRTTWWLEVAPVFIALPALIYTRKRFPLTPLLYWIIAIHALVLIAGGAWSYARVPLGFWMAHAFALSRNPYDKIGHFFQGMTPALLACEILLRGGYMRLSKARRMSVLLAICVAMAVSACYELIEWGAAVSLGQGADEFLGTQGDPWDTQSDMFMALVGASFAMLFLRPWHTRQMQKLV